MKYTMNSGAAVILAGNDIRLRRTGLILLFIAALLVPSCSALYHFDGFDLTTAAQGQVDGEVFLYTITGLQNSPRTLSFEIPADAEIQWSRTYVGVWGGTPRYTGWVQVSVNGHDFDQVKLYGQDDKTPNVWCTGYGVYWTAWDTTSLVKNGQNNIVATTSQGQPENKLDGRIYGITTVVVAKTPEGSETRYWIMEGNVNLHGEGWTEGANPTVNDETSALFYVSDLSDSPHANLTIIEITSTRWQPDYVLFNSRYLGSPVTDTTEYPAGAYDIADEISYNDGYGGPEGGSVMGRYYDIEIFDVTSLVQTGNNELKFIRGIDLDGDGTISTTGDKPEGEDYVHPVFAMLTLETTGGPQGTGPSSGSDIDLSIGKIEVKNAYNGETATITATIQNLGTLPSTPVSVAFLVDGTTVAVEQVTVDASGIQQVSTEWQATTGTYTIGAEVTADGDDASSNNAITKEVTVGTLPDLIVTVDSPRSPGESATTQQESPLPAVIGISATILSFGAFHVMRRRNNMNGLQITSILLCLLLVTACLPLIVPASSAADTTSLYLVPVTVKNAGGSDASAFEVTIYLDGEMVATKTYDDGLSAGMVISADIPVYTVPGSHTLKVVVDEAATIRDGNRSNNVVESTYVFP